ncbi:hypothetical protein ACGIF2_01390 [Cellulomonas sp. P22]|uniref:hypothetical protein n=1 Tax=Cellulomonas sp. P22 TaxID=3373189 RepID=UPI0037A9FAB4
MKRLFWVAVGVGATVLVFRKATDVLDRYVPANARQAAGTLAHLGTAARGAKAEFLTAMSEREAQLRHDLVGDVDVEAARATRTAMRTAHAAGRRRHAATRDWADGPTEDPEDDPHVPYSFF